MLLLVLLVYNLCFEGQEQGTPNSDAWPSVPPIALLFLAVELRPFSQPAPTHLPQEDAGKGISCPLVAKGRHTLSHWNHLSTRPPETGSGGQHTSYKGLSRILQLQKEPC